MKNFLKLPMLVLFLISLVLSVTFVSCKDDDSSISNDTQKKASVEVLVLPSSNNDNDSSRDVNRPATVLPFIDEIEITADHIGTISAPYIVSDVFSMKDDGSGEDGFLLEDVALGVNKFNAYADTYQKSEEILFDFLPPQQDLNSLLDDQRAKSPYTSFSAEIPEFVVYEDRDNLVAFDMEASSGRFISLIKLDEDIVSTYNTNFVVVRAKLESADGSIERKQAVFDVNNYDNVLRFYWSDIYNTATGSKVTFTFIVCDSYPIITNQFNIGDPVSFDITTGESLGVILTVNSEEVIEDVNNFVFSFDWEEL